MIIDTICFCDECTKQGIKLQLDAEDLRRWPSGEDICKSCHHDRNDDDVGQWKNLPKVV